MAASSDYKIENIQYLGGCECLKHCITCERDFDTKECKNCQPYFLQYGIVLCRCNGDWLPVPKESEKTAVLVGNGIFPTTYHLPTCRALVCGPLAECSHCTKCPSVLCTLPKGQVCKVNPHIWGEENKCEQV